MTLSRSELLSRSTSLWLAAAGMTALPSLASAQLNNQWLAFSKDNTRLSAPSGVGLNDPEEKDYAWADLDKDGWVDLVVMRKEGWTTTGRRANVLLMNENGVLTDRTSLYATASDVSGGQGFLDLTNDRDVVIADVTGDGWLDVITCTTLSAGTPKNISHPRIYRNLGNDVGGNWLGLKHEDFRFPQLYLDPPTNSQPSWPRFCGVDANDVDNDGDLDLYFSDYDQGGSGGGDMQDRLLINDGTGVFTDESHLRMTPSMLESAFGMATRLVDMNLDGAVDVVKDTALFAPQYVAISYNNPASPGTFNIFHDFHHDAPYHVNVGDLNADGRPDVVVTDDGDDRYRYNLGVDGLGRVSWGPSKTFDFATGFDDGFGGNNLIIDLDNDGWNEAIITDVDVDISGCDRYMHIYRNPGGAVGAQIDLIHERESTSGGWRGVVGMQYADLNGVHDVAVFDIDRDGDLDMVLGRCTGTDVWMNQLDPAVGTPRCFCDAGNAPCANPYGTGGCENSTGVGAILTATGSDSIAQQSSQPLVLHAVQARPDRNFVWLQGATQQQVAFRDGNLCVGNPTIRLPGFGCAPFPIGTLDNTGATSTDDATYGFDIVKAALCKGDDIAAAAPTTRDYQLWYRDGMGPCGTGSNLTNAVSVNFVP